MFTFVVKEADGPKEAGVAVSGSLFSRMSEVAADPTTHGNEHDPIAEGVPMNSNVDAGWVMSSRSSGNGGSCVEARRCGSLIEVRNSKTPDKGSVWFTPEEWDSFLYGAKRGEFDQLLAG
jgi:hypothetical protein